MRAFHRALATSVATLAIAAAGLAVATPAAASPEDGKGCVGTPAIPESYVCVISTTPEAIVPSTSVTNVPVTVPRVCYFLDCAEARTVAVPVPGVTPRSGVVAVLWYRGQYIPIAVGTVDAVATLYSTINFATQVATGAVGTANATAAYAATLANGLATTAIGIAGSAANDANAAVNQTVTYLNREVAAATALATSTAQWALQYGGQNVDAAVRYANETVYALGQTVDREVAKVTYKIEQIVNELPTLDELYWAVVEFVNRTVDETLASVQPTVDSLREAIAELRYTVYELRDRAVGIVEDCLRYCLYVADIG